MTFRGGPISAPPEPSRYERIAAHAKAMTAQRASENFKRTENQMKKISNEFSETIRTLRDIGKINTLKKNSSMSVLIKKFDKTEPTNSYLDQTHGKDMSQYSQPPQQTGGYIDDDSFFITTSLKWINYHGGGGGHIAYKLYGFIDNKFIFMNTSKSGVGPGILNGHQYFMYHPLVEYTFYNELGNKYMKLLYNFILESSKIYIKTDNMSMIFKYVYELDTKNQKKIERKQKKIERKQKQNNFGLLLNKPPYIENVNDNNKPFIFPKNEAPTIALNNQPPPVFLTNEAPTIALNNQPPPVFLKNEPPTIALNNQPSNVVGKKYKTVSSRIYNFRRNKSQSKNKEDKKTYKFWRARIHPNNNNKKTNKKN